MMVPGAKCNVRNWIRARTQFIRPPVRASRAHRRGDVYHCGYPAVRPQPACYRERQQCRRASRRCARERDLCQPGTTQPATARAATGAAAAGQPTAIEPTVVKHGASALVQSEQHCRDNGPGWKQPAIQRTHSSKIIINTYFSNAESTGTR